MENPKIKRCVAQNVGKVWTSRKKSISGHSLRGPEKSEQMEQILPIFLGGPMGPILQEYYIFWKGREANAIKAGCRMQ